MGLPVTSSNVGHLVAVTGLSVIPDHKVVPAAPVSPLSPLSPLSPFKPVSPFSPFKLVNCVGVKSE